MLAGQAKSRESIKCQTCRNQELTETLNYPPDAEMVAQIKKIGLTKYAETLGRTSNAIKKYLKRRGYTNDDLRIEREAVIVICSSKECKTQLTPEEVKMTRKRCAEHHVAPYEYPPLEDIIEGVNTMGYNRYAESIGIKYGSTVRKYLARHGIIL